MKSLSLPRLKIYVDIAWCQDKAKHYLAKKNELSDQCYLWHLKNRPHFAFLLLKSSIHLFHFKHEKYLFFMFSSAIAVFLKNVEQNEWFVGAHYNVKQYE